MSYLDTLNSQIKNKDFSRVYLFYGGDEYLRIRSAKRILNAVLPDTLRDMNLDIFEESAKYDANAVFEKCGLIPFLAEKRVVIVKNSRIFAGAKKDDTTGKPEAETEKTEKYLTGIPDSTILIFIEEKADKRLTVYKQAAKAGECIEFSRPADSDMIKWITAEAKNSGAVITPADAAFFLSITPDDMGIQQREIEKLAAYTGGEIKKDDILLLAVKSLESNIFRLVDAIGQKDIKTAIEIYNNLIYQKESPFMILAMITRQFRMILACLDLKNAKKSDTEAEKTLNIKGFAVKNYQKQSKNFTRDALKQALRDALDLDMNIKKGLITDQTGVLMLIVKCAG